MRLVLLLLLIGSCWDGLAKERVRPRVPEPEPKSPSEWQLVYQRTERTWKNEEAPREVESTLSIRLGPSYFYVFDGKDLRLHDLQSARFIRISGTEQQEEYPLVAEIQSREKELRREVDQLTLLARAGTPMPDAELALFFAESRAGMSASLGDFPGRMTRSGSDEKTWTVSGAFVAGYTPGTSRLPVEYAPIFDRMMLYTLALHPEIRLALAQEPAVPRAIRYREKLGSRWKETELRLSVSERKEDSLLPELKPTLPTAHSHPLLLHIAVAAGRVDRGIRPPTAEEFGKQYRELVGRGLHLEALLAILEFYLQSGADTEQPMSKLEPFAEENPDLRHFMDALAIGSPDEGAASLALLSKISRNGLMRRHLYDIAAANAMLAAGRYREAEPLYLSALEQNPWLTGVYKKLGDLYAASERLPLAWTAYEAAISINASHPMLKGVRAEAPRLRQSHPGFFLPPAPER